MKGWSVLMAFGLWAGVGLGTTWGFSYLDLEQLVKSGMPSALIKTRVDQESETYTYAQLLYLQERGLPNDLLEYLVRYYLVAIPEVTMDFLLELKQLKWSDEIISLLINRYGFAGPLTTADTIRLKEAGFSDKFIDTLMRLK